MDEEKVNNLIEIYQTLFEPRGIDNSKIKEIEKKLGLTLPKDLKKIASVFDGYETMGGVSLFSFDPSAEGWNVIEKTEFYRLSNCNLPRCYLALREEAESFVVMKTQEDENLYTPIIWCSLMDAYNLQHNLELKDNPTIFPSFTDFFAYLLEQEEQERKSDKS